jgi:hypothetical protein
LRKYRVLSKRVAFIKTLIVLIVVFFSTVSWYNNDDDSTAPPVITDEIKQPLNPNDPAVFPEVKIVLRKLEGDFTPLLTSVVTNENQVVECMPVEPGHVMFPCPIVVFGDNIRKDRKSRIEENIRHQEV